MPSQSGRQLHEKAEKSARFYGPGAVAFVYIHCQQWFQCIESFIGVTYRLEEFCHTLLKALN